MVNDTVTNCVYCGFPIPPKGGEPGECGPNFGFAHLACSREERPMVSGSRSNNETVIIQNNNGRCEDAPCCGCCGEVFYPS